jgi:hypothetical protein
VLEKWQNQRLLSPAQRQVVFLVLFLAYWLVKEVRGLYCGVGDFFFLFLPAVYVTFTKAERYDAWNF